MKWTCVCLCVGACACGTVRLCSYGRVCGVCVCGYAYACVYLVFISKHKSSWGERSVLREPSTGGKQEQAGPRSAFVLRNRFRRTFATRQVIQRRVFFNRIIPSDPAIDLTAQPSDEIYIKRPGSRVPRRPHPFEQHTAWINLTNCITDTVLERCVAASYTTERERERVTGCTEETAVVTECVCVLLCVPRAFSS